MPSILLLLLMLAKATSQSFTFVLPNLDVDKNPWITYYNRVERTDAGYRSIGTINTYALNVVGLWPFNNVSVPVLNAVDSQAPPSPIVRTSSFATVGESAILYGTSQRNPLVDNGRFSRALWVTDSITNIGSNWGQVWKGPLSRNQPLQGFTIAAWFKPSSLFSGYGLIAGRRYENAQLFYYGMFVQCAARDQSTTKFLTAVWKANIDYWSHLLCTYDPVKSQLSLYVNGSISTQMNFAMGAFAHGDFEPICIGGTIDSVFSLQQSRTGYVGGIDDLAMWSKALNPSEVIALFTSNSPLVPASSAVLVLKFERYIAPGIHAVIADWSPSSLQVQLSSDNGISWCNLQQQKLFTDENHDGGSAQCFFPATRILIRIQWTESTTMTRFTLSLYDTAPNLSPQPLIPMGLNLNGVNYYSTLLPFTDVWQGSGGNNWGLVRAGIDENGWPLQIVPYLDNPPNSPYWVVGRNIMLMNTNGTYPRGVYTLLVDGSGIVELSGDGIPRVVLNTPIRYNVTIDRPGNGGVQLMIQNSVLGNYIRRIGFFMPGFLPTQNVVPPLSLPPESAINPVFLQILRNAGVKRLRFMDWGLTNDNNVAFWRHRNTPSTVSQDYTRVRRIPIQSIRCDDGSAFTRWMLTIKVTTFGFHGLVTGNVVSIVNADGYILMHGNQVIPHNVSASMFTQVHVLNPFQFLVALWQWKVPETNTINECIRSTRGQVQISMSPGVSYEYMIRVANTAKADAWVCIPHLAGDEYIRNMAKLFRDRLNGKLYIEYSNEVWNNIFTQTHYATRMAELEDGDKTWDAGRAWAAKRAVQVFRLFDSVYGATDARQRIIRVIATQMGGGSRELAAAKALSYNSFSIPVDAIAIAPYFGTSSDKGFSNVDDVLDYALWHMSTQIGMYMDAIVDLANERGIQVLAYEGGQHFGGGGDYSCPGGCENNATLQALFIEANRNWRMQYIYDAYLRQWAKKTFNSGFFHFSFIATPSKWGSWGALEYMTSTVKDSPKWAAMFPYFRAEVNTTADTSTTPYDEYNEL
jgi:hypothetical protein